MWSVVDFVYVHIRALYRSFLPEGKLDSTYVFLNMFSMLCFPLVWLVSCIWQKCKK